MILPCVVSLFLEFPVLRFNEISGEDQIYIMNARDLLFDIYGEFLEIIGKLICSENSCGL